MNSASRILRVLEHFHADKTGVACVDVWRGWLGRTETSQATQRQVNSVVLVFLDEIDDLRQRLEELSVPESLHRQAFGAVENAFQPTRLEIDWNQSRGNLTEEVMMAWRWCAWYISNTDVNEAELDAEALQKLSEQLQILEGMRGEPGLPKGIRGALERQIEALQRALQLYALVGASALEEAYRNTSGDFLTVDVEDRDLTSQNREVVSKMANALRVTAAVIGKSAVFFKDGVETISFYGEGLKKLFGPPI